MTNQKRRSDSPTRIGTSWDPLAEWYDGWVGEDGSKHHRLLAIPALLDLLAPQPHEAILDLGAGQGVLAPAIAQAAARYTGVEASPKLVELARRRHGRCGRFICGDARRLARLPGLQKGSFAAVCFLLSLQDMDPLEEVLAAATWALAPGGRLAAVMTHPCFRVPRQSGWGWDLKRKLRYRRVDRYLTALAVPLKPYPNGAQPGVSRSFHRPLSAYVQALGAQGLYINDLREIPTYKQSKGAKQTAAENRANAEIPLFLGLSAIKVS
jgi:SAM-dependent methyltransferase